jgi:hypothetical protein
MGAPVQKLSSHGYRRSGFSLTTVACAAELHRRSSAVVRLKPDLHWQEFC